MSEKTVDKAFESIATLLERESETDKAHKEEMKLSRSKHDALMGKYCSMLMSNHATMEKYCAEMEKKNATLEKEKDRFERCFNEISKTQTATFDDLQKSDEKYEAEAEAHRALKKEYSAVVDKLDVLNEENIELKKKNTTLHTDYTVQCNSYLQLLDNRDALRKDVSNLERGVDDLKKGIAAVNKEYDELDEKYDRAKKQLSHYGFFMDSDKDSDNEDICPDSLLLLPRMENINEPPLNALGDSVDLSQFKDVTGNRDNNDIVTDEEWNDE